MEEFLKMLSGLGGEGAPIDPAIFAEMANNPESFARRAASMGFPPPTISGEPSKAFADSAAAGVNAIGDALSAGPRMPSPGIGNPQFTPTSPPYSGPPVKSPDEYPDPTQPSAGKGYSLSNPSFSTPSIPAFPMPSPGVANPSFAPSAKAGLEAIGNLLKGIVPDIPPFPLPSGDQSPIPESQNVNPMADPAAIAYGMATPQTPGPTPQAATGVAKPGDSIGMELDNMPQVPRPSFWNQPAPTGAPSDVAAQPRPTPTPSRTGDPWAGIRGVNEQPQSPSSPGMTPAEHNAAMEAAAMNGRIADAFRGVRMPTPPTPQRVSTPQIPRGAGVLRGGNVAALLNELSGRGGQGGNGYRLPSTLGAALGYRG